MSEPTTTKGPAQTLARPFPWFCPKCRRQEVQRVTMPYRCERLVAGKPVTLVLEKLSVPRCGNCGELVFDYEAEEQIKQACTAAGNGPIADSGAGKGNAEKTGLVECPSRKEGKLH